MSIAMLPGLLRYWGKALRSETLPRPWHPLILHCLDVAAVADALMKVGPEWLHRIAAALRLVPEDACRLLLWLIVLHDLGKFAGNFQVRVPELAALAGLHARDFGGASRHDAVGLAMVEALLDDESPDDLYAQTLGQASPVLGRRELLLLLSATTGHHGAPRSTDTVTSHECWNAQQLADARTFALALWSFFALDTLQPAAAQLVDDNEFNAATWDIAGLTIVADWLGSNVDWFPYATDDAVTTRTLRDTDQGLQEYWLTAQQLAAKAVQQSGLGRAQAAAFDIRNVVAPEFSLRPSQQASAAMTLPAGGSLTLLEDQTGSGKTEAALILLHRLMAEDKVDGVFLGLPTQATANALYRRLMAILPKLVRNPSAASAVLAHSARDYNAVFRSGLAAASRQELALPGEQEPAGMGCAAWLAESTKRALLAQFGVGTIDQSLLTILRSKHQALRLYGLDRKLLLIDEVHAYDAYQTQLLKILLARIAARGGHVVLLSATLPQALRQQFIDAFARGLRRRPGSTLPRTGPSASSAHYPLLTRLDESGLAEIPVTAVQRPHVYRVRYMTRLDEVIEAIVAAAQAGKAVAWIRNTVSEASAAWQHLHARLPFELAQKLQLFHARFALGDRLEREGEVLRHFGSKSTAAERAGRILIATQVIEQSLDVDFDVLVTDDAPMDLLIQRAGRLMRHIRDVLGNPLPTGTEQRGEAELLVYGPDRHADVAVNWVSAWSAGTARVYANHVVLWRSAQVLGDRLDLAAQPRYAIEAVYDSSEDDVPPPLRPSGFNAEAKRLGDAGIAGFNTIAENEAYEYTGNASPDERDAPTRLGEQSLELVLARQHGDSVLPWQVGVDDSWVMSLVRVRANWLPQVCASAPCSSSERELLLREPALRYRHVLVLEEGAEFWSGRRLVRPEGSDSALLIAPLFYDTRRGLWK